MIDSKKPSTPSSRHLVVGFDGTALFRKTDGIGRYTYNLLRSYAETYPDTTIMVIGFVDDDASLCDLLTKCANVSLHRLPFPRRIYQGIYSRIVRIPVDIFLPHLDALVCTNFVRFPYIKHAPSLVVIHDLAYIRHPEVIEKRNLSFLRKHVPLTLKRDYVVAASSFTKSEIEELFMPKHPVSIVSNGIDSSLFTQSSSIHREGFILTVGTIEPRKNLSRLLVSYDSMPETVKKEHPLIVVGSGGWGDQLPPDIPYVSYTGHIPDNELINLYKKAGLFVFPSLYEGFGLPVLESLVSGTKTICSNITPLRDIAEDTATYFDPLNESDIASKLVDALSVNDTPNETSQSLAEKYSWQESAHALNTAINSALQEVSGYSENSAE